MRKESIFKKKYALVIALLLMVVGIGVGYAYLQTTLTINGNTTINAVTWNVHFANAAATANSNVSEQNGTVAIDAQDPTKATYTAVLEEPGDIYEFTIDVVNDGSIDAKLASIVNDLNLSDKAAKVVNYTVTGIPTTGTVLPKKVTGSTANTYQITVHLEYIRDIEPTDLPDEAITISKEIDLNYVQNKYSE